MIPSQEQARAIFGSGQTDNWITATLPTGRQVLPAWVKGVYIDWMDAYGNVPHITVKVHGDVYQWSDQQWAARSGGLRITRSMDGRARALYHRGAITKQSIWIAYAAGRQLTHQWQVAPTVEAARRAADANIAGILHVGGPWGNSNGTKQADADTLGAWVKLPVDVTTRQEGFGGSHFLLPMVDGSERLLRGPWSGPTPPGYVDVYTHDMNDPQGKHPFYRNRPWRQRPGGRAGLLITHELLLKIIATYAPHVRCALVQYDWGTFLEVYKQEWGMPKRNHLTNPSSNA